MPFLNVYRGCPVTCGLVHYLEGLHIGPVPVPLAKVDLNVRVVDFVAEVSLRQEYVNRESRPIEAVYLFPVEEEAAVVDFEARLDGREIKTNVKEKEEARQEYNKAVRQQTTAFLLEEAKQDVFEMKVGHLKPGSRAEVVIKYVCELPVEEGAVRLAVPTTIAPRYTPPTDNTEAATKLANVKYSVDSPAPLMIEAEFYSKGKIKSLKCPTHRLTNDSNKKENGMFVRKASLAGVVADMDRDFVLLLESEELHSPKVFLEKSERGSYAGMVSLVPEFKLREQRAEMIFVVDRSGSMGGGFSFSGRGGNNSMASIEYAKEALKLFLHSLPADCFFNIVSFGSRFTMLFPGGESAR